MDQASYALLKIHKEAARSPESELANALEPCEGAIGRLARAIRMGCKKMRIAIRAPDPITGIVHYVVTSAFDDGLYDEIHPIRYLSPTDEPLTTSRATYEHGADLWRLRGPRALYDAGIMTFRAEDDCLVFEFGPDAATKLEQLAQTVY